MTSLARRGLPAIYLALCLLLGGSSSGGVLATAFLQLSGIGLIAYVYLYQRPAALMRTERHLLLLGGCFALIGICQLIPVSPAVWRHFPGRGGVADGFALLGTPLPYLSVSLWPAATLSTILALIPPLAIVVLAISGGSDSLRPIAWTLVACATVSFVLGFAQIVGSDQSPLYFYHVTNRGESVGFFANSNHLSTLGIMSLPFLAALATRGGNDDKGLSGAAGKWAALGCLAGLIMFGVVIDRSFAGIGLLVPSMIGSYFIFRAERARIALPVMFGVVFLAAAVFVTVAYLSPSVNGFALSDLSLGAHGRANFAKHTYSAFLTFLPLGSGLGTFIQLYPQFDHNGVTATYVNHAHNDWLEFLLEGGLPAVMLLGAFLIWWARQAFFSWRDGGPRARFARAASVASGLAMMHSLVDYPLRTPALGVLFALCCALVARPLSTVTSQLFSETAAKVRGRMVSIDD